MAQVPIHSARKVVKLNLIQPCKMIFQHYYYLDTNTEIKAWQFVVCVKTGLLQLLKRITHVFSNYSLGSIIQKQSKLNKYEIANLQDIPLSVSRNSKKDFIFYLQVSCEVYLLCSLPPVPFLSTQSKISCFALSRLLS